MILWEILPAWPTACGDVYIYVYIYVCIYTRHHRLYIGTPPLPVPGAHLQNVVAVRVTQVPSANFSAHVPATEWGCRELQASDFQQHVGYGWEGVPAQVQLSKPFQPGMSG